jgi:activator of HSP90 ATPase
MAKIFKKYVIKAPAAKVWAALTQNRYIQKWSESPSKMSSREGADFKLWDGDIYGENIEVVPEKRLVQNWFGGDWEEPSIVTFNIKALKTKTRIELIQENVPNNELKSIDSGWDEYYFGPMTKYLEEKFGF